MAVPAHDDRDWEFAKKFHLPIIQVVAKNGEEVDVNEKAFTDVETGILLNSDFLNGLEVKEGMVVHGDFTDQVDELVLGLLECTPDADAIVCANDEMALGLYEVIRERGLVPGKDIKVMGFDNSVEGAKAKPSLSSAS